MGTANLSRRYSGGSLMLTTHIHLVPKLGMKGAIRSLPLYTFRAWGRTLIFYFYCCCCYCCCCTVTVVFIAGSLYLKTRKNFGAMIIYIYFQLVRNFYRLSSVRFWHFCFVLETYHVKSSEAAEEYSEGYVIFFFTSSRKVRHSYTLK